MTRGVYSMPEDAAPSQEDVSGGLASDIRRLLRHARSLLGDQLKLFALEARRAARALGTIVALGVAAGILLACTWLGLSAACALWLMEQGTRPSMAMLAASLLDLLGVLVFGVAIQKMSGALTFPASYKSLQSRTSDTEAPL